MRIKSKVLGILLVVGFLFSESISAKEIIKIAHADGDMTTTVRNAIENAKEKDIQLIFEKGIYKFLPDYAVGKFLYITNHGNGFKKIIFNFEGFNAVEIDGQGSEFIFHGLTAPFVFEGCNNIDVQNVTIDWDIPFSFQGDVLAVNEKEKSIDIKPYTKGYSWELSKGQINFPNIDGFNYTHLGSTLPHNKATKAVDYGAWDMELSPNYVEKLPGGNLRIFDKNLKKFPRVGAVLHSKGDREHDRYAPAFLTRTSKNIRFQKVIIHHALGMGFLFERSEKIDILSCGVYIREGSDRVISATADATHFANCKGEILIENCRIEGMYDDGTNVHGTYVEVDKILNENTVRVGLKHFEQMGFQFAGIGDEIWFIQQPDPNRASEGIVKSMKTVNDQFVDITFNKSLPATLKKGDILENKTWNPVFTMRGNTIRDHRARNIIIKTPLKITIENNNLSSMMSSIMLRGETYFWFESGAVGDVLIRNNHFNRCAYGGSEHAVLTVSPRIGKEYNQSALYDRNIIFENNTIETFDNRIVWADRLDGFIFRGNKIIQTTSDAVQYPNAFMFDFENCNNIEISNNSYEGTNTKFIKADAVSRKNFVFKKNKGIKDVK